MSPFAKVWVEVGPYLGIGWVFAVSIGVFAGLGWWLDPKLGTTPWLLVAGSVFGILIGFANFFKVVLTLNRNKQNKRP